MTEKFAVAPIAWLLNDALNIMSLAFSNIKPLLSTVHASQNLVQAIPPGGPPLLQLPYFTPAVVQSIEANVKEHLTVHEYLALPSNKRKKLSIGPGLLTEQQYQSAVSTALQFPSMHIDNVWFLVDGEHSVTPNSLCELVIRFRFIPPGTADIPDVESDDESQKDRDDADKRKKRQKGEDDDDDEDRPRYAPPLAHAPLYAKDHSPVWYVFLGDAKTGRIAVPPYTYTTFSRPVFGEDGELLQHQQTLSMQFGAPSSAGKYSFVLHVMNDSYMGFDIKEFVTMEVVEADAVDEDPEEDEEEEVPPEDEDESNTEGDVDDDTSDTNTDTDEE
jgi:translocation protein SEC63